MSTAAPRNPCVLLVEDHPDTLRLMSRLLRRQGYAVHEATNCAEALAVAEREGCRVLVSDVELPDCTGLDLMRELRARNANVRGVAVSGHTGPERVRAARDAGFERHVAKPFKFDELLKLIDDMLN
jgi:CheY-like chemotaxis protein